MINKDTDMAGVIGATVIMAAQTFCKGVLDQPEGMTDEQIDKYNKYMAELANGTIQYDPNPELQNRAVAFARICILGIQQQMKQHNLDQKSAEEA